MGRRHVVALREGVTPRVVAIVQARTGSRRLPEKVLADLAGKPLLVRVVERAAAASSVDEVVIATGSDEHDDRVEDLAKANGVRCHRGSEEDVLARVTEAAEASSADVVVRLTGDCPLLDPEVIDEVVAALVGGGEAVDYASNVVRRTFPRGLDAEALDFDALRRIDHLATSPEAREHVTWFAYRERPDLFLIRSVEAEGDWSHLDWSVDDEGDLATVRSIYERFDLADRRMGWRAIAEGLAAETSTTERAPGR